MTIKEIAKIAGVSVSTVSKIMNNKDTSISSETREHVLKIAKEYNYKAYSSVINSNIGKTLCIGVILRHTAEVNRSISGILSAANAEGYSVIFRESRGDVEQELKNILALIRLNVDGIIIEPIINGDNSFCIDKLNKSKIPYLTINNSESDSLNIDFTKMGYEATRLLIQSNHTDIACYLGDGSRTNAFFKGYKQCMFDNNIPISDSLIFYEKDGLPVNKLPNHQFSGIVVSHYKAALQLYNSIVGLHYTIPYDISMISLQNDSSIEAGYPDISTLTIPRFEFGKYIVKRLIYLMEQKKEYHDFITPILLNHSRSIDIPFNQNLKKVISIGSINIDNYMNCNQLPHTGIAVTSPNSSIYLGGKCINEAIGVAKLGHNVAAIGRVGDDSDADFLYGYVKDYSINTVGIKRSKNMKTGQAYIFVQNDGDSMITIMSGANNAVSAQDVIDNERLFNSASYCLMQTEVPMEAILKASELAKKHNIITVLKPSACNSLPDELLKNIDIIVPNLEEFNLICPGNESLEEKAKRFLSHGISTIIITMGSNGCYIKTHDIEEHIPAEDFISVDSSGAGDAFISALVSYLLYGYNLITSAKIATYAAGLSITRQGTTPALIDKYTLESYINQKKPNLLNKD